MRHALSFIVLWIAILSGASSALAKLSESEIVEIRTFLESHSPIRLSLVGRLGYGDISFPIQTYRRIRKWAPEAKVQLVYEPEYEEKLRVLLPEISEIQQGKISGVQMISKGDLELAQKSPSHGLLIVRSFPHDNDPLIFSVGPARFTPPYLKVKGEIQQFSEYHALPLQEDLYAPESYNRVLGQAAQTNLEYLLKADTQKRWAPLYLSTLENKGEALARVALSVLDSKTFKARNGFLILLNDLPHEERQAALKTMKTYNGGTIEWISLTDPNAKQKLAHSVPGVFKVLITGPLQKRDFDSLISQGAFPSGAEGANTQDLLRKLGKAFYAPIALPWTHFDFLVPGLEARVKEISRVLDEEPKKAPTKVSDFFEQAVDPDSDLSRMFHKEGQLNAELPDRLDTVMLKFVRLTRQTLCGFYEKSSPEFRDPGK